MNVRLPQPVRFVLVGVSNTLWTLVAFTLLTMAGVAPVIASMLAFAIGAANGYVLNRIWTFRTEGSIARYIAVQAVGAGLSAAGVAGASAALTLTHLAAEALVLPMVTIVTYSLSRRLVFRGGTARA